MKLHPHFKSQKFSGFIVALVFVALTGVMFPNDKFGNATLAISGLFLTFVGGRSYSDAQAMKAGKTPPQEDEGS